MKRIDRQVGKSIYKVEIFESVMELARVNKKREITPAWENHSLKKSKIGSWEGVGSYDEAYQLLETGWEEATKQVNSEITSCTSNGRKRVEFYNDVQGFMPVVPLSLLNVPNSMINNRMTKVKSKVINIVYDLSASSSVDASEMIEAGKNMVEAIMSLESNGYRCELSAMTDYCDVDAREYDIMLVKIKNANQTLNLRKMMFPMAHSAQLRVVGFDWQDKTPIAHYVHGRGKPYYCVPDYNREVKFSDIKKVLGENTVYLNYKNTKDGADGIKAVLLGGAK